VIGTALEALLKALSVDDKKSLIESLSRDILNVEANDIFHRLTSNIAKCPHCGSYHIIKKGVLNGKQKFFCKDCGKWFSSQTKTPLENSKKLDHLYTEHYGNLHSDEHEKILNRIIDWAEELKEFYSDI
jgi:transposase-like protein